MGREAAAARSRQGAVTYVVRYSNDEGKTWRALAADLSEPRLAVNLDLMPGGERCLFQVVASSGIRTSTVTSEPIEVPHKPRRAEILAPEDGATLSGGEEIEFLGGGFSPDFKTADYDEVVWTSSRDGNFGIGYQVVTNGLSPGRHRITGGEARASVMVTVR